MDENRESKGGRVEERERYLVHLDRHDAASLRGALGAGGTRASDIAADVGASDVRDGVVGHGKAGTLSAVVCVSWWFVVGFDAGMGLIMSTPSTQRAWKVACEATCWAAPRRARYADFMVPTSLVWCGGDE